MNAYRHITLLLLFVVLSLSAMAQRNSALEFESTTIDFGTIAEAGGKQSRSFTARNVAEMEIVIEQIVSTCDCTVVEYDARAIAPDESFSFEVVYDPWNRPGRFERTLFVIVADEQEPIELEIKGRVEPRERSVEEIYPYDMGGGLRLESTFASFSYVEHGKEYQAELAYTNTSNETITLRLVPLQGPGVVAVDYPRSIEPGVVGDITFCYSLPLRSRHYGVMDDRFAVEVDGSRSRLLVTSYAIAVDNFDDVDDILSPRAIYSKKNIKFEDVNPTLGSFDAYFELKNDGGAPLIIRQVECDSPAVKCSLRRGRVLDKGESCEVRLRLKAGKAKCEDKNFSTRLNIVTNDPIMPLQVIRITATIHNQEDNELDK